MITTAMSPEVTRHTIREHYKTCPFDRMTEAMLPCPCGGCVAICCPWCDAALFLLLEPGKEPCEHAQEAMEKGTPTPGTPEAAK
jgi:hypothetical protein